MSDSIHLYQSVSLSPSTQSAPSSSSHSLLIFPPSSPSFHNIPSSVSSTAVDLQHFLKPFTVTSDETHCHAVVIHTDEIIHLHLLFINVLKPMIMIHNFLYRWHQVVLRILYMCVPDTCFVSMV